MGRHEAYKEQYCDEIVEFMSKGKSITAFASSIGVTRQTVWNWGQANADFFDAINIATEAAEAYWEEKLAYFVDQPFKSVNTQALMFLMKARFKVYREQMDIFASEDPYVEPESFRNDIGDSEGDLDASPG